MVVLSVIEQKHIGWYTDQNYKRNTFVSAPICHELNSKI